MWDLSGAGECAAWVGASDCPSWVPAPAVTKPVRPAPERGIPPRLRPTPEVTPRMPSGQCQISCQPIFFPFCSAYGSASASVFVPLSRTRYLLKLYYIWTCPCDLLRCRRRYITIPIAPIKNPHTPHATQVATVSLTSVADEPARSVEGGGAGSFPLDDVNSARAVDGSVMFSNPIIGGLERVVPWCMA